MSKRKIFFRADAGQSIGYGHFIRTLALADMLKDDFDCTFFTQTPTDYQKSEAAKVCQLVSLPSDDSKFDKFLNYLQDDEILVLDNYFYTSNYQKQIKDKGCKLVCIDDIHDRHFYADAIINHCTTDYRPYKAEKHTSFYMGAGWALLRQPFLEHKNEAKSDGWLITFGGSDQADLTSKYALYLKRNGVDRINVLVGDGYTHQGKLLAIGNVNIYSKQSAEQVASLMRANGNVICSASSVCYESLACGCRVFAGYYVDNQKEFYESLKAQRLIYPLGELLHREPILDFTYQKDAGTINFEGLKRHYQLLFKALSYTIVPYQEMTECQSRAVWECRNRDEIRKWMVNPEPFSFESHNAFIEGLKQRFDRLYYAFFDGDEFVGSYDFVDIKEGESAERGLYVNPDYQRGGIASMMETYMDGVIRKRGLKYIYAEVIKTNTKSLNYHLKCGYKPYKDNDTYLYLRRNLI